MRKITEQLVKAFSENRRFKSGNDEVTTSGTNVHLWLHGNNIARNGPDGLEINLCGWNTMTTRDRLNGLPGVNLRTVKGTLLLNGSPVSSDGWVTVGARVIKH